MRRLFLCAIFVCLSLAACGSNAANNSRANAGIAGNSNGNKISFGVYDIAKTDPVSAVADALISDEPELRQTAAFPAQVENSKPQLPPLDTASSDRKIIRNADLDLEADDPEDAQRKITSITEQRGGFVVESQQSSSEITSATRDIVTMTVRVPAHHFSEALADIRNVSKRVVLESVKGQDVTEEFIDIEAQIKAKKALEQQFMEIMKRAETVEEALSVQSQLANVRGDIERVEGRKRFLENQSSLSTIRIRLQTAKVFAASSVGFGGRLADSFTAGADVAINFVLGLVTVLIAVLPFAAFVGLPAFLFFRYVWKRQLRPRSVIELAEDELKSA
jgi:hypothetical protein